MRLKVSGFLLLAMATMTAPAAGQVVINEILPDPGSQYDGAEFVELHNKGAAPVDISGWIVAGTEYSGLCGGEDGWAFPALTTIPAFGYIVFAKDNADPPPGDEDDGFLQRFGFDPDFEMYDITFSHDSDDSLVPNMVLVTPDSGFDDQIGLIPGSGYARDCSGEYNQYEALYLYNAGSVLQDAIEYMDPTFCTGDACPGVGNTDNDAYVGLPDVGQSLGRDASSTDTNSSNTDHFLGTPTPKAANIPNPGPVLSGLSLGNPDPFAGESTTATITASDVDGIGPMWLVYAVNGGAPDSSSMTLSGPGQYTGTIPGGALVGGDQVAYFVRAYDAGSPAGFSKYPDFGSRAVRWGTQTIFSVQFHSPPSDAGASAEVGNAVNVEGIVTTENGPFDTDTNTFFTIQSAAGPWNGVHVIDYDGEVQVQRGDSVRVSGTVGEYFNLTQIEVFGQTQVGILSNGNPLPAPNLLGAGTIATGTPTGEAYEGTYTRLEDVEVTLADDSYGQWEVTDGSGTAKIGDYAFYNYSPTLGDSLNSIEGIVTWTYAGVTGTPNERKLEPRDDGDIVGPPIISSARYSPTPPTAADNLIFSADFSDNGSITRAMLYYSLDNGGTYDSTAMSNIGGTQYEANLGAFPNGTEIDYHFEATDNDGFDGQAPSIGDYDLYVGFQTIVDIQSSMGASSDTSIYNGSPTNVGGIVTVAPGVFADNIFCIQNNWTISPANHGIWVFSGGSLVGQIAAGDSVEICGDVDEFYNLTQIRMHFTDAYTSYGNVGQLPAYDLSTTDLPTTGPGVPSISEQWEGVLVMMPNSVVTNSSAGFGQYYIDNTDPRNTQETLVDDDARISGLSYEPALGDSVSIRGVVTFSYDEYKILPRFDGDILPYDPADAVGVQVGAGSFGFALHQNAPNPFAGRSTRIGFALPQAAGASLRVFDVQGRLVRTLVNGPVEAGSHVVDWNGLNENGREVSTGVYFYRLEAEEKQLTKKMILLR